MLQQLTTVMEAMPYILEGGLVSLLIVVGAMMLGLAMGIPMAVGQVYGSFATRGLIGLYVWFFRGVPILVLMFLFYFGVFELLGLNLSAISATALVLGMTSAAYQSQIFRGAIQALPAGQLKAARALGMKEYQAIQTVILPQTLRLSLPGWSNEYSIILKDSALAYVVGAMDIFTRTHFVASRTYEHLPLFIAAGVLYFIITLAGVKLLAMLEKKIRIPGYTT